MNYHLKYRHPYSFRELSQMELSDTPNLEVVIDGREHPIQTSHVTDENLMLNCPAFADTIWHYEGTTSEWIPCFKYVGDAPLESFIDYEPSKDRFDEPGFLWVTPKGSPREQYVGDY